MSLYAALCLVGLSAKAFLRSPPFAPSAAPDTFLAKPAKVLTIHCESGVRLESCPDWPESDGQDNVAEILFSV